MVERAKRFREPFAWFLLGCAVVQVVAALGRWYYLQANGGRTLAQAARLLAGTPTSLTLVTVWTIAVLTCALWQPATAGARRLATATAVVIGLSVVLSLVMLGIGLTAPTPSTVLTGLDVVGGLVDAAIKLGCMILVWRLGRVEPGTAAAALPAPVQATPDKPLQPPSWTADKAVGTVWTRAGDAASGAAADGFGGGGRGWQPASREAELPQLPAAEPRKDVPWATAGQQAAGEKTTPAWQPAPESAPTTPDAPRSWQPARPANSDERPE